MPSEPFPGPEEWQRANAANLRTSVGPQELAEMQAESAANSKAEKTADLSGSSSRTASTDDDSDYDGPPRPEEFGGSLACVSQNPCLPDVSC